MGKQTMTDRQIINSEGNFLRVHHGFGGSEICVTPLATTYAHTFWPTRMLTRTWALPFSS